MDIVGIMWEIVYMDGIVDNVYDGKYCVVIECRWNGEYRYGWVINVKMNGGVGSVSATWLSLKLWGVSFLPIYPLIYVILCYIYLYLDSVGRNNVLNLHINLCLVVKIGFAGRISKKMYSSLCILWIT